MICPHCGGTGELGPEAAKSRAEARLLTTRAESVLAFLNHKTGRNYQSDVNVEFIRQRLKAGATEAQCRAVIARKVREWTGDDKMEKFLRPQTLFNRSHFASYLGELPATAFNGEAHGDG